MANIAIFKEGRTPQYLTSVNPGEHRTDPDAIINPDVSFLDNVALKYWKRVGDNVFEMTEAEKQNVLDAELQMRKNRANTFATNPVEIFTALIKVINVRLPSGQKITKQELIDAIKSEIL